MPIAHAGQRAQRSWRASARACGKQRACVLVTVSLHWTRTRLLRKSRIRRSCERKRRSRRREKLSQVRGRLTPLGRA
eukprot:6192409-Pleurochrysis_carterae.AAC.3